MIKLDPKLKERATEMRKAGSSYGEIRKEVKASKSTLSLWLKNVSLTPAQKKRLYTKNVLILSRGPQSQKERRIKEIAKIVEEAEKEIQMPLPFETYRLVGAFLYWAEGDKTKNFNITNSDPDLIAFMVKWFESIFQIKPVEMSAWLNIYPQQNDRELKQFWSQLTGVPLKNFGKLL